MTMMKDGVDDTVDGWFLCEVLGQVERPKGHANPRSHFTMHTDFGNVLSLHKYVVCAHGHGVQVE